MKINKKKTLDYILFGILFLIYICFTYFLFYRQTIIYGGGYSSDSPTYLMEMQGIDSGYSFPYPVMFMLGRFLALFMDPSVALSVAITFLNGLSPLVLKYFMDRKLSYEKRDNTRFVVTLCVFGLMLISMLFPLRYIGKYFPVGDNYLPRYIGIFSPNPYQNATYLCARPFAIASFFLFIDCIDRYEAEDKWFTKEYLAFGLALLLGTLTKPSFTLVLAVEAAVIMIYRLVRSKFRGYKAFFQFGIYFIPTFMTLLVQFGGVFVSDASSVGEGIRIGLFTAWSSACNDIPKAIVKALAFPIVVFLCHIPSLIHTKNKYYTGGIQFLLAAFATFALLYETGERFTHLNFCWGYMYGLFFMHMASLMLLTKDTFGGNHKKYEYPLLIAQWGIFCLHLVCGIDYFKILLSGGFFF